MDKAISSDQAYRCIKALVELGGAHYVGDDLIIRNTLDDSIVGVETGIPPKNRPIAVFKVGMKVGDYVPLNPFADVITNSPERAWFNNKMMSFPGAIIHHLVQQMIKAAISEEDVPLRTSKFISKWMDKFDKKMLEEAGKIRPTEWAKIFYDRQKHCAQLQSDVGMAELKEKYGSRIRKSSWPVFTEVLKFLLQLPQNKKPESIMYTATIAAIPKVDAILHVVLEVVTRLDGAIKALSVQSVIDKINVKELTEYIKHIDIYREATRWFATASARKKQDVDTADDDNTAPWRTGTEEIAETSTTGGASVASEIASLKPTGMITNPRFVQGDWSSDVCSSDLYPAPGYYGAPPPPGYGAPGYAPTGFVDPYAMRRMNAQNEIASLRA